MDEVAIGANKIHRPPTLGLVVLALLSMLDIARPAGVEPLPASLRTRNAGLFVGVNQYTRTNFSPLKYAVNDAVAQAERFALELKLIPAGRTFLLLAGEPTGTNATRLRALESAGAHVVQDAARGSVLETLETTRRLASSDDSLLVVSLSGHGYECERVPYFVPEDGRPGLPSSFVSLVEVKTTLEAKGNQKRWLFVDACRLELIPGKGSFSYPEVTKAFRNTFLAARGRLVFVSCDAGQVSQEDDRSAQGVFTGKLLEAIDNAGANLDSEFVTIGHLVAYASHATYKRAEELSALDHRINSSQIQRPWFEGPADVLQTPVAISPDARQAHELREKRRQRAKLLVQQSRLEHPALFGENMAPLLEKAIDTWDGPEGEMLLNKIDSLLSPKGDHREPEAFLAWWREMRRTPLATTSRPKAEFAAAASRPLPAPADGSGKRVVLLTPVEGLAPKHAAAAILRLESVLRGNAGIVVRRASVDSVNDTLNETTAARLMSDNGGHAVVSASITDANSHLARLSFNGTEFNNQVWSATLTVTIAVTDGAQVELSMRAYLGQRTYLDGQHVADGTSEAIADAIEKFAADTEFMRPAVSIPTSQPKPYR